MLINRLEEKRNIKTSKNIQSFCTTCFDKENLNSSSFENTKKKDKKQVADNRINNPLLR